MTSGLRTLLRMDPDIVFIGEIRDAEAGDIGMRAASSGKYVFSTLHTRDVAGTVTALRDLNIDNRSLAANVTGIVNQRLVRRLCQCRERVDLTDEHRQLFEANDLPPPQELFGPKGCEQCRGTGYRNRTGVFEAVMVGEEAQDAIARGLPESELRQIIRSSGTFGLTWDALRKVSDGITSIAEANELRWA
jgi:type II secretory ATPase GspE/PulE/Tfp pilus assembly ATPase PilB-like protein